ncbi:MAG: cytochrome c biogenesis protein CcsA [Desulfobulbaceae bacterium]|nr:cytochrome c biogenesis protein CcsA [Desulfobulbaceae bacterium]
MDSLLPMTAFTLAGRFIMHALLVFSCAAGISGVVDLFRSTPLFARRSGVLPGCVAVLFVGGFLWICWFHYQIFTHISLELPAGMVDWLNRQLAAANRGQAYGLPLYDPVSPPRYCIPVWIENEKYFFWFMSFGLMAFWTHCRMENHRLRAVLRIFLGIQACILFFVADPFQNPLPKFFAEIAPWFDAGQNPMARFGLFMRLYPKMVFYYNAEYMWFHPPLLFLSYAAITMTFIASIFMLARREQSVEAMGYAYAKFGYFMLTLGMLLGYPWALKAWGPNWWWDPKICSSIMMWAIFSTYLHTRLYANKKWMWYFTSILGILCFAAMVFTFLASFFFPGEHTFQ